jgi:hypothetical protein
MRRGDANRERVEKPAMEARFAFHNVASRRAKQHPGGEGPARHSGPEPGSRYRALEQLP